MLALASAIALSPIYSYALPELPDLQPTKDQQAANIHIARQLLVSHYKKQSIDRDLSTQVFDAYLKSLDSQRAYFLQSDIDAFEVYRYRLDGALKTGQLDPAFKIYNTYQTRVAERLEYMLALLNKGIEKLDFTKDESLIVDREELSWPANLQAQNDLWRKRLKNAVLSLKLNDKTDEDIQKTLTKRYTSQLSRIQQSRSEDAFQTYMNAFTGVYDPHTSYFSPRTSENFNINMSLSLEGIGAVLQSDNEHTKVVRLVPAGPAHKAGELSPEDRIVGVGQGDDGEIVDVVGWRLDEVVDLIRGPAKSTVRLEVIPAESKSDSDTKVISIVRDKVKLEEQAAQSKILELDRDGKQWKFGIIDIPAFYADFEAAQRNDPNYRSTTRDVRRLIDELQQQNIDGLVIDLRDNGGGSLVEANTLTGLFIPEGPTVQIRNANNNIEVMEDPDPAVIYGGPLVVLVNRLSASASEIFAGAIQDYGRGVIMGGQTFGKGTVQSVRGLNHGQIKLTQAKFYRISGASTQHKGVIPDLLVPSAVDKDKIGEDALPSALPWDSIQAANFSKGAIQTGLINELRTRHVDRFEHDPEYQVLLDEISYLQKQRDIESLTLVEKDRRQKDLDERTQQLALTNARRLAQGKEAFASYDAWEADKKEKSKTTDDQSKSNDIDFVLKEGGHVLVDLIELQKRVAQHQ